MDKDMARPADQILDMVRRMHSDLAQYDYLLPGDYVPEPPLRKHWFRWRPAFAVTDAMLIWAGGIARARTLMDLKSVEDAIAQDIAQPSGGDPQ